MSAQRVLLTVLISALAGADARAQVAEPAGGQQRKRVGIALSGGSARGCAHAGVLKALERLRVPVDAVAGTSIGAVVGGSYAAGYSPDEIISILTKTDWNEIFSDRRSRLALPFRRKEEDLRYLSRLELGVAGGRVIPPRGVIAGQKLAFLLARYALPIAGVDDFDRLPVPFRAVATDLVTGRAVVLARGDLADSLRASMAIPAMFAPVEIDNQLLVDGGSVNKLPVDVVRSMGVDVVLAVNVSPPLLGRDQLDTLVGIARQISDLPGETSVRQQLARADVAIEPKLEQIDSYDFARCADIVALGEATTLAQADVLAPYAVSVTEYQAIARRQRTRPPIPSTVGFVKIEVGSKIASQIITNRIRTRPGMALDLATLERDLTAIYEVGDFESVSFRLAEIDGVWGVIIRARPKPWGPNYLRFGLTFENDMAGDQDFSALIGYSRTRLNRLGAELRIDMHAGRSRRVIAELYQPLDTRGRFFVAPAAAAEHLVSDVYDQGRKTDEFESSASWGEIDLGVNIARWGELRLGVFNGTRQADPIIGAPELPKLDLGMGGYAGSLIIDTLDNGQLPSRGVYADLHATFSRGNLGADDNYDRVSGSLSAFFSTGKQTYFTTVAAGNSLGTFLPTYDEFTLGGLFSFSGYRSGELRGQRFATARIGIYPQVWRFSGAFGSGARCGAWVEAGGIWGRDDEPERADLRYSFTAGCSSDTPLGPVHLAVGTLDDGDSRVYLGLGKRF
jgi:NTE family protein